MNDPSGTDSLRRNVNIASAIDKSSFQTPVFIAISAEGGEAQVVKTFATAREVFDHVFSILLDRLRQRRAVEAVERLVPQSAHLTTSRDTEYVLLVRGKAIFWFSGAAAKRAAGRRLLLEHARDLAEAEQAPFYVLNSRSKKVRAAIVAAGVIVMIAAILVLKPFAVDWARASVRHPTVSIPRVVGAFDGWSAEPRSLTGADSRDVRTGRSANPAPAADVASRHARPASASIPKPVEPEQSTAFSKYEQRLVNFARAWPDQFHDRLRLAYLYSTAKPQVPPAISTRVGVPQPSPSPTVAERQARVSNRGIGGRAPAPDRSKP